MTPLVIMMMYARAEPEADWPLYLKANSLYYMPSMEGLPQHVLKCFMNVELVKGHIPGVCKSIYRMLC